MTIRLATAADLPAARAFWSANKSAFTAFYGPVDDWTLAQVQRMADVGVFAVDDNGDGTFNGIIYAQPDNGLLQVGPVLPVTTLGALAAMNEIRALLRAAYQYGTQQGLVTMWGAVDATHTVMVNYLSARMPELRRYTLWNGHTEIVYGRDTAGALAGV